MKIFIDSEYGCTCYSYEYRGDKDSLLSDWKKNELPFLQNTSEGRILKKSGKLKRLCTSAQQTQARLDAEAIVEINTDFGDHLTIGYGKNRITVRPLTSF
jgi:hypothetical protein